MEESHLPKLASAETQLGAYYVDLTPDRISNAYPQSDLGVAVTPARRSYPHGSTVGRAGSDDIPKRHIHQRQMGIH